MLTEKTAHEDLPSLYSSPNIITVTNQIFKKREQWNMHHVVDITKYKTAGCHGG
jgi:hypothetical protein